MKTPDDTLHSTVLDRTLVQDTSDRRLPTTEEDIARSAARQELAQLRAKIVRLRNRRSG